MPSCRAMGRLWSNTHITPHTHTYVARGPFRNTHELVLVYAARNVPSHYGEQVYSVLGVGSCECRKNCLHHREGFGSPFLFSSLQRIIREENLRLQARAARLCGQGSQADRSQSRATARDEAGRRRRQRSLARAALCLLARSLLRTYVDDHRYIRSAARRRDICRGIYTTTYDC